MTICKSILITTTCIISQAIGACLFLAFNKTMCCEDRIYLILPLLIGILVIGGYMALVTLQLVKKDFTAQEYNGKAERRESLDLKAATTTIKILEKEKDLLTLELKKIKDEDNQNKERGTRN